MIKPGKMIGAGSHGLKNKITRSSIGLNGLNFSRWIASKYGIFYGLNSMPALVFRKFFGIKTMNSSSHPGPCNTFLSLLKYKYFINTPLQKTLSISGDSVKSVQDVRTCTKNRTSMTCYYPAPIISQNAHQHFYAESAEETNSEICLQNKFVQNKRYRKIIGERIRKVDKQFPTVLNQPSVYKRDILTTVNLTLLSYLQKIFDLDTSTKIQATKQDMDTSLFSVKPVTSDSQHNKGFGTAFSDPYEMISKALKMEIPSVKYGIAKGIKAPSLGRTRTLKDDKNISSEQMGREKEQFIQKLHQASISSERVLTYVNQVIRRYLHRDNTEAFISKTDSKKQSEELEKQSTPMFFHQPSLYKRNVFTSLSPLMLSYLQKVLNFEFAGLKPGRTAASITKMSEESKSINAIFKGLEIPSFKKTEISTLYENNAKQIGEIKNQRIRVPHHLPSSKMEFTHLGCKIKQRQVLNRYYNSGNFQFPASVFLVQLRNSYEKNLPTSGIQAMLSYLQSMFNFDTSTNMNAVSQGMDTSITSVKPVVSDYRHKKGIETAVSDPDEMISAAIKVETPSAKTRIFQGIKAPLLRRTRTLKDDKNISSGQMRREREQFIQRPHQASISSKKVLKFVNPVIRSYLHRNNTEIFISKTDSKIPVVRPGTIPSKQNCEAFSDTRNVLTSLSPLTINYLQEAFNFGFSNLFNFDTSTNIIKPGRTVLSSKKMSRESKIASAFTQDANELSYQQIRNIQDLEIKNSLKNDADPGSEYIFPSPSDVKALKESINTSQNSFFQAPLVNLKRFDHIIKKTEFPDANADLSYNSRELVFKKPASQKTEIVTENKGNIQTNEISPNETHENQGKDIVKEKKIHEREIGIIADRVYRIIEKRISIEKDRRGLF